MLFIYISSKNFGPYVTMRHFLLSPTPVSQQSLFITKDQFNQKCFTQLNTSQTRKTSLLCFIRYPCTDHNMIMTLHIKGSKQSFPSGVRSNLCSRSAAEWKILPTFPLPLHRLQFVCPLFHFSPPDPAHLLLKGCP